MSTARARHALSLRAVIHQEFQRGTKVKEGTSITLDVSDGWTLSTVPSLAGLTTDAATKALTNVGLALGTVGRRFDDRATLNTVIDWAPKGDQPKRTKVDIIVSAGPRRVPNDLKGKSFADAQAELKALGLTALESDDYSDDVQTGQVFGSDPPPGSAVPEGGQVTLKVSKGAVVWWPGNAKLGYKMTWARFDQAMREGHRGRHD